MLCADPLHGDLFVTIPIICLIDRQIVSGRKHSFFVDGDNDQNGKCSHLAANVNQNVGRLKFSQPFAPFSACTFFILLKEGKNPDYFILLSVSIVSRILILKVMQCEKFSLYLKLTHVSGCLWHNLTCILKCEINKTKISVLNRCSGFG